MPVIDMPIEELKAYQGRNPRPADFDDYWQRALAELEAVDPQPELVPAEFQPRFAECFNLYFTGVGGSRIHAKYVRPSKASSAGPAVLEFHGYSMSSGSWLNKLPYAAAGLSFASLDVRGQGGLSQDLGTVHGTTRNGHIVRGLADSPDKLFYRQVFLDTAQLARVVGSFNEVDPDRMGTMGWSQGGALSLACAALVPTIRRAGTAYPFLSDYQRVWEMDLIHRAYSEIPEFFKRHDPLHEQIDTWWQRLGYIDVQHLAPRIQAEVLLGTGLMDDCCPPSSQFAAYNKIRSPKQVKIYPNHNHEFLPDLDDHFFTFFSEL